MSHKRHNTISVSQLASHRLYVSQLVTNSVEWILLSVSCSDLLDLSWLPSVWQWLEDLSMDASLLSSELDAVVDTGDNLLQETDHLEGSELGTSSLLDLVLKAKEEGGLLLIWLLGIRETSTKHLVFLFG